MVKLEIFHVLAPRSERNGREVPDLVHPARNARTPW